MVETRRVAVFGGSFNPPGRHHRAVARRLARIFDRVIVVPCGLRPDKRATDAVAPRHRAALARLAFSGLRRVRVDTWDLAPGAFLPTYRLSARYRKEGEVWLVVGADLVRPDRSGRSVIEREWKRGRSLWKSARFAVVARPGYRIRAADLPPHAILVAMNAKGSSRRIRADVRRAAGLLLPAVRRYIERHGLYR